MASPSGQTCVDNTDGRRLDVEAQLDNPVRLHIREQNIFEEALRQRRLAGDIFFLLNLLSSLIAVEVAIDQFPLFLVYAGSDCSSKWTKFLDPAASDAQRSERFSNRLSEALGVTEAEVAEGRALLESGKWSMLDVAAALDDILVEGCTSGRHTLQLPLGAPECMYFLTSATKMASL